MIHYHQLFNIFINDSVDDVNSLNLGVTINGHRIGILLYPDDIVLQGETEKDLQKMFDSVYKWSKKYKIKFNVRKSTRCIRQTQITHLC